MRRKLARAGSRIRVNGAMLDLAPFERICAIAIGKASVAMVSGLVELLSPDFRAEGIVVTPSLSAHGGAFRIPCDGRGASRAG